MKKLMRRFLKVGESLQCFMPRKHSDGVPKGHLPVYVGDEMERFVVRANLLKHPAFVMLLNKAAREYGYEQQGALRIPCNVSVFKRVLETVRVSAADVIDVDELLNSLAVEL